MQSLEHSARTRFKPGERCSLAFLNLGRKHPRMLTRHVPLPDQVVEFLHGAFATVIYPSTHCTHMQALVQRMSSVATLLACPSFPARIIVMPLRSAVEHALFSVMKSAPPSIRFSPGSAPWYPKSFSQSEVATKNTFRGYSSPFDPPRSESDPLSSISTRRALTARAGFAGI